MGLELHKKDDGVARGDAVFVCWLKTKTNRLVLNYSSVACFSDFV